MNHIICAFDPESNWCTIILEQRRDHDFCGHRSWHSDIYLTRTANRGNRSLNV